MQHPYDEPDLTPLAPAPPAESPCDRAGFETLCQHLGEDREGQFGAAALPIYQASTFVFPDCETFDRQHDSAKPARYVYSRVANPTTAVLQTKLAALEKAEWCFALGSGMSAISAALNANLHAGAHVVCVERAYWPAVRYMKNYLPRFGVETTFVNSTEPAAFLAAIRPNTRVVYLESPTSGTIEVLDIEPITRAARERGVVTMIDNSWASPYFFNPLEFGVDLVMHSATKYIGGHSDVVAGAVMGRDEKLRRRVYREAELVGGTIDPFASWLLLRGLRTLGVRIERMSQNALQVAKLLAASPKVARVRHPLLEGSPQYSLARRYLRGSGSLFTFELSDTSREAAFRFVDALKLFSIGVSWGGHESLALAGRHFSDPANPRWAIRMHCGLETPADLLRDVEQALERV